MSNYIIANRMSHLFDKQKAKDKNVSSLKMSEEMGLKKNTLGLFIRGERNVDMEAFYLFLIKGIKLDKEDALKEWVFVFNKIHNFNK